MKHLICLGQCSGDTKTLYPSLFAFDDSPVVVTAVSNGFEQPVYCTDFETRKEASPPAPTY
jgi:hypothetical protein